VQGVAARDLRGLVDQEKKKLGSGVVALVLKDEDGKGTVAVGVTDDLTARLSAADLVRRATAALGGQGGGGRPDMAQGGGPDGSRSAEALAAVRSAL
jgi:alanyl-tRNA synthetase